MSKRLEKSSSRSEPKIVYADAGDEGFRFIFPGPDGSVLGGLRRERGQGHFVTLVGRGGTGKSFLALQLVTHLLEREKQMDEATGGSAAATAAAHSDEPDAERVHTAFYFTLEASPRELAGQARQFTWGKERYGDPPPRTDALEWKCNGLQVVSIPSPVADLSALILLLRQTIANQLHRIGRLTAIVIDPMGGVLLSSGIRNEISQLRELASSHHCFLFLLTEEHLFDRYHAIEHYSQTVIHLRHDPKSQPYRWLYVQKSRGQNFRSGFHQLEFDRDHGIRVFPSIEAQSAFAHEMPGVQDRAGVEDQSRAEEAEEGEHFIEIGEPLLEKDITRGSVLFLMGPPGTNKQLVATQFASLMPGDSTIYISFKADIGAVESYVRRLEENKLVRDLEDLEGRDRELSAATYFLDARSPLLTPEEVLSRVRVAISRATFSRAVVWGLRRLNDMPNFSGGKAVQFLEALVTLLRSSKITSLLVDWPDKERASTLPIVDLSQYILLTRVCQNPVEIKEKEADTDLADKDVNTLWGPPDDRRDHATFLRVQRTREGFYRDRGVIFLRPSWVAKDPEKSKGKPVEMKSSKDFERLWKRYGIPWEEDPDLVN